VRAGAISGAVSGALQPVAATPNMTNPEFFAQKVEQTGAGTAFGGLAGYGADKLSKALFGNRPPAMPVAGQPSTAGAQSMSPQHQQLPESAAAQHLALSGRIHQPD